MFVVLAAACASCTGITLGPERPKAQLERSSALLALRGGEAAALTLPKLALGANIATWGFYGANLWAQPNFVLQKIMMAPSPMAFLAPNYAVAQYLGAFYLSQTARMALAFNKASSKSDLLGATVINSLLCLTSVGRIAGGVPANAVTLGLVAGQGAMAALSFVGFSKAA